jgi:hypothetical protein
MYDGRDDENYMMRSFIIYTLHAEHRGRVGSTCVSYSGGPGSKSRPEDRSPDLVSSCFPQFLEADARNVPQTVSQALPSTSF